MSLLQDWYLHETLHNEENRYHRPMKEEMYFYHSVSNGNLEYVQENCRLRRFSASEGVGILSRNPITNLKYHFVITAAFITRLCVEGGMEMEQAYRLSDFYILRLENLHNLEQIISLHDVMVLDYTEKMRLLHTKTATSKPVIECIEYIYAHIKDRITIDTLTEHTGFSAGYLSRLFKREVGVSVSSYIRAKKIDTAKNLLKYGDYSMIELANYLSFSSQSHFIQQFKKSVGMTPKKYRDTFHMTSWSVSTVDKSQEEEPGEETVPGGEEDKL